MTPYYEREGVVIYHGDAGEIAPSLGVFADVIVTDPPYGVKWISGRGVRFGAITGDDGATSIVDFLRPVVKCLRRGRHIYCFGATDFGDLPVSGVVELVWDKGINGLGDLSCPWATSHERVMFGVYNLSATDRKRGGGNLVARMRKSSILRCNRSHSVQVKNHPTEKPVQILREMIESSSRLGETVFDPFAGSGSTLVAALTEGRKAIGIEIEERYCEVAARRLSQEVLFGEGGAA
jgi:DNA modification methylase